ncbi:hypothetical protein O0I10_006646 [Lichtheimia ornata]|uniref:F-box domain-containing protein n=1 Tax=Lichtheimia ornata TaxID=688661 RepID=A0AAD7V1Y0_9FUNG|nr:uncharacterized protein O0I10_006646 [Lichtheimia ornata]KAJ8657582.1 hypothetical protein O0I10_006646 [Lichtheimia ornata]
MTQSPQCNLSTLNLSALELSKLANFDAALHDANIMQQTSPTSALGYIRAAAIYSEQGKQHDAIDVCTKGLSLVDTNDTHYAILQQVKHVAMRRQNKRIDFISQLPVEIVVTRIIPLFMDCDFLDLSIPYAYMHVSKVWRDRIHECFGGLRFMVGVDEDPKGDSCSQLVQFARHAKGLIVASYSQGAWLSDILRENDFGLLRDLHINGFANVHGIGFLSALKSISNTLTHLHIKISLEDNILPTADIVSACPNLKTLDIVNPFDADMSSLPMTTWPNMKKLSITKSSKRISSDQVVEIAKRFPSLRRLTLLPCNDTQSALILPEYCSSITMLRLQVNDKGVQLSYSDEGYPCDEKGITALSVDGFSWTHYSDHNIIPLLKHYHKRLIYLEWDIVLDIKDNAIYSMQYPRLQKLVLNRCGGWIPRNAPALEELEITSDTICTNDFVLDTIPPHLQILTLRLNWELILSTSDASIEGYIHGVAQEIQLKDFVIRFNSLDDTYGIEKVLDAICHLNTLTRLGIGFTYPWDGYQMERFLDQLTKGCPCLSCLEIKCPNAPSTQSMNTLKRLGSLKEMAFPINGIDDGGKFWNAVQTFSQLKCITIYPARAVIKNDLKRLKRLRPDMRIVVDTMHGLL